MKSKINFKKYSGIAAIFIFSTTLCSCVPSNSNSLTMPTVDSLAIEISKSDAKIIFDACKDAYFAREKLANQYMIGNNARIEHEYYGYGVNIDPSSDTKLIQETKDKENLEFSYHDKYLNLAKSHYVKVVSVNESGEENTNFEQLLTANARINKVGDKIHYIYENYNSYYPENSLNINESYSYNNNFQKFYDQYFNYMDSITMYEGTLHFFDHLNYFNEFNALLFELNEKYYSKGEGSLIVEVTYKRDENWTTTEYYEFNNYLCVLYAYSSLQIEDYGEYSNTGITKFEYDNVVPKF